MGGREGGRKANSKGEEMKLMRNEVTVAPQAIPN